MHPCQMRFANALPQPFEEVGAVQRVTPALSSKGYPGHNARCEAACGSHPD